MFDGTRLRLQNPSTRGEPVAVGSTLTVDARRDLDGSLRGWLPAPDNRASAIALSRDARWIAIGGETGTIYLYDSDAINRDFARHREPARELLLSHDGELAVSTDSDNTHLVWSTATGERIARIEEPCPGSRPIAFTRDGSLFTSSDTPTPSLTFRRSNGEVLRLGRPVHMSGDRDRDGFLGSFEWRPSDNMHFWVDTLYTKARRTNSRVDMNLVGRNGGMIPLDMQLDDNNVVTSATFTNAQFFLEHRPRGRP